MKINTFVNFAKHTERMNSQMYIKNSLKNE